MCLLFQAWRILLGGAWLGWRRGLVICSFASRATQQPGINTLKINPAGDKEHFILIIRLSSTYLTCLLCWRVVERLGNKLSSPGTSSSSRCLPYSYLSSFEIDFSVPNPARAEHASWGHGMLQEAFQAVQCQPGWGDPWGLQVRLQGLHSLEPPSQLLSDDHNEEVQGVPHNQQGSVQDWGSDVADLWDGGHCTLCGRGQARKRLPQVENLNKLKRLMPNFKFSSLFQLIQN